MTTMTLSDGATILLRALSISALAILANADLTLAGGSITSIQPGDWHTAAIWDLNRIPDVSFGDEARIGHDIFINTDDASAASVSVGFGVPARLDVINWNLDLTQSLLIGRSGGSGVMSFHRSSVTANWIQVGNTGPGTLIGLDGIVRALGTDDPHVFRVGANGFPGTIRSTSYDDLRSASGFLLGAAGTIELAQQGWLDDFSCVVTGDLTFEPGSILDASESGILDEYAIGDRFNLFTYSGALSGLPTVVSPFGYNLAVNDSVPGVVSLEIIDAPAGFEWTAGSPDSYFTAVNWSGVATPIDSGRVYIRNGGTSLADGTLGGAPALIRVNELHVGDHTGAGTLETNDVDLQVGGNLGNSEDTLFVGSIDPVPATSGTFTSLNGIANLSNTNLVAIGGGVEVGILRATGTAIVEGTASLTIENVTDVTIGGDLDLGGPRAASDDSEVLPESAVATSHAYGTLRNITNLTIGDDLDIANGGANVSGAGAGATATVDQQATALFENITSMTIDDDFRLAPPTALERETENSTIDVTIRDVDSLTVGDRLYTISSQYDATTEGVGADAGAVDWTGTLTIERSAVTVTGDLEWHDQVRMSGDGVLNADGTFNLIDSTLDVDGDVFIGMTAFAEGDPDGLLGGGAPGNTVNTHIELTRSRLGISDILVNGASSTSAPGIVDATIELREGSVFDGFGATGFVFGDDSTLIMHIDGPAGAGTGKGGSIGEPGYHSVIETNVLAAGGALVIDFDIPVTSGDEFRIIEFGFGGAYFDDFTSVTAVDLPDGLTIDGEFVPEGKGVRAYYVIRVTCVGDLDGSGATDFNDLVNLLAAWGPCVDCSADLDGNGDVDFNDLVTLLAAWGTCP